MKKKKKKQKKRRVFSFFKLTSSRVHPPIKPRLLGLSKQCHQLGSRTETPEPTEDVLIQTTTPGDLNTSLTAMNYTSIKMTNYFLASQSL